MLLVWPTLVSLPAESAHLAAAMLYAFVPLMLESLVSIVSAETERERRRHIRRRSIGVHRIRVRNWVVGIRSIIRVGVILGRVRVRI
jgi:hypothetical protein